MAWQLSRFPRRRAGACSSCSRSTTCRGADAVRPAQALVNLMQEYRRRCRACSTRPSPPTAAAFAAERPPPSQIPSRGAARRGRRRHGRRWRRWRRRRRRRRWRWRRRRRAAVGAVRASAVQGRGAAAARGAAAVGARRARPHRTWRRRAAPSRGRARAGRVRRAPGGGGLRHRPVAVARGRRGRRRGRLGARRRGRERRRARGAARGGGVAGAGGDAPPAPTATAVGARRRRADIKRVGDFVFYLLVSKAALYGFDERRVLLVILFGLGGARAALRLPEGAARPAHLDGLGVLFGLLTRVLLVLFYARPRASRTPIREVGSADSPADRVVRARVCVRHLGASGSVAASVGRDDAAAPAVAPSPRARARAPPRAPRAAARSRAGASSTPTSRAVSMSAGGARAPVEAVPALAAAEPARGGR